MLRRVIMSMGNTVRASQLRMARAPGKVEEPAKKSGDRLDIEPEYKDFKSVDQMAKGMKDTSQKDRWMYQEHKSATDEINHRGIDQRAKEWNVDVAQVEKLKQWEEKEAPSHLKEFKKTVLNSGAPKEGNLNKQGGAGFYDGAKFYDMKEEAARSDKRERAGDVKDTNKDTTRSQINESNATKMTANDEINHRGIDQRAKEWKVPVEKLEELKPWEHHPSESNPELYKKTILKGKKEAHLQHGFKAGSQKASQQYGTDTVKSGDKFSEMSSGSKKGSEGKLAADIKYSDKATGENTAQKGSFQEGEKLGGGQVKNAQNSEDFDQGMVDKAMSWVKDKFGATGSSGKEGPTADHNALNKGFENHRDSVHKATFTEYQDSKKPFTSTTDEPKKTEKKETKNYL